jgi:hypothetical protein
VTTQSFEEFLFLSVDLTAFEETELLGTGLAHHYLAKVRAACGDEVVTALLDAHRAARADAAGDAGSYDRALLDRALRHRIFSDDRLGPVARNVIKLWYAGMWYGLPPRVDRLLRGPYGGRNLYRYRRLLPGGAAVAGHRG